MSALLWCLRLRNIEILLYRWTVHIEPPVTDEVLLVEKGAVGAEEAVLDEPGVAIVGAYVESLAVWLRVSVVPFYLGVAEEGGLWRVYKDGVVLAGYTRDILGWTGKIS